ncbi:MAG: hypothetical protein WD751_00040 [Anaerolineales bacterium]
MLILGFLLFACATPPVAPTPTPEPTATPAALAKPGHWEGEPEVSFVVDGDGMLTHFKITIAHDCMLEILRPVAIGADSAIIIGNVDSDGLPLEDGIIGIFGSSTTVKGTIANPFVCGNYKYGMSDSMTEWNASWVGP